MKPFLISFFICSIAVLAVTSCSGTKTALEGHGEGHDVHWGYEEDDGPDRWATMNSDWILCAEGRRQSPVDLVNTSGIDLGKAEIHTPNGEAVEVLNQMGVISELDNGHTIQINAKTGETMTIGGHTYALVQLHFHAPSEHTVAGEHFPMEAHFVHQAEDGKLAVVGVFIEEGKANPGIAPFWTHLSKGPGAETTVRVPFDFAKHIFPRKINGIYHYSGSLTTPPCTEGVNWFISRETIQLSKEQIRAFTAIYDHNNRPVQALNERTLYMDEHPKVTIDYRFTQ